jgi:vitamin B12 transporter
MKNFILIILLFSSAVLNAQVRISGKIKDNKNKPLADASVTLKGTYDGATSDSSGNFSFSTSEKGAHVLEITCVGFNTVDNNIDIEKDNIAITISLKEKLDELKAVNVSAGAFAAGDTKRATVVLNAIDIATVGGGNADITSALKTLPGAQQIGEQEGLFVRGGEGYETKQFIDGTLVNNPYYTSIPDISTRGRFSPFLFSGTVFTTGGYSALYGQALSSALLLQSIDLPDKSQVTASFSPLLVGGGMQELSKNKNYSYGIDYDYVNVGLYFDAVPQLVDYFKVPQFHTVDANFRIKTKSGGMIKYYTTFNYNDLGLRRQDVDSLIMKDAFSLTNHNWYNNLSWRENLGDGWKMNIGSSFSTNLDNISSQLQNQQNQNVSFPTSPWYYEKAFTLNSLQNLSQIKAVIEKKLGGISTIRFGGEDWYAYNKYTYDDTTSKLVDNLVALFAEGDIHFTNELAAQVGVRFEHSSIIDKSDVSPRISLAYKVGKGAQISAAFGTFYQKPELEQLIYTTNLNFLKATHYIVNYQKIINQRIFRVEAFYKQYNDLIKTVPVSYNYDLYDNAGSGYAKGIELFWRDKKTFKDFDYWISYSYLDTKRDFMNYPYEIRPDFATTHTASLVMKRFITKIKTGFNFTYSFATGRPYYDFLYNSIKNDFSIGDQGTTKDYNSLGFSMNYVPSIGKKNARIFWVIVASVTNVLGANNVYGYNYSLNGENKLPILPPAKRFYFVGVFLSWGVDRTQDAINNNL